MKRISFILAICIIFMTMQNFALATENVYTDTVRVGLSYGSSATNEAWFYSESPVDVVDAYYLSYITTIPANTRFKISAGMGALSSEYFSPMGSAIRLDSTTPIFYDDNQYRGSFELRCHEEKIIVINIVNTEEYIASVLGKEMSASWPLEALKAQAVCARNYAVKNLGKHSSYGFDICNTTDCQVYGGIASEAESTRLAVAQTDGVLVTYKGKVVPLFYFSCDGGYTEDSENVWISAEGYLRGKQDVYENPEYATLYNWSKTLTKTEIEDILASKNMSVGELLDIRIDEMSNNNGVIKLTFVGTEGEKSVTKTQTRTVLSLNSQAYTIEKHSNDAPIKLETEVISQYVLTGNGVVNVNNPQYAMTADGIAAIPYAVVPVQEETDSYDSYTFNGHGWGHLVGMSQWGAYSMAMAGYNYKDILSFYYTDIVIEENQFTYTDENLYVETPVFEDNSLQDETYDEIQRNDTGI